MHGCDFTFRSESRQLWLIIKCQCKVLMLALETSRMKWFICRIHAWKTMSNLQRKMTYSWYHTVGYFYLPFTVFCSFHPLNRYWFFLHLVIRPWEIPSNVANHSTTFKVIIQEIGFPQFETFTEKHLEAAPTHGHC